MFVKFKNFNDNVVLKQAHVSDAGTDVFVGKEIIFEALSTQKVPLGFGMLIPYNFVGYIEPRTSVAAQGLIFHHCPIDAMYRGELIAIVTNPNPFAITIPANKALCQVVVQPVMGLELVHMDDWHQVVGKQRGEGAFGSSDATN
jgi:dUTP pyrophosphatase